MGSNRYGDFICLGTYEKGVDTIIFVPEGRKGKGFQLFVLKEAKNEVLQNCSEAFGIICSCHASEKYASESIESIFSSLFHADLLDYGYSSSSYESQIVLRDIEASVAGKVVGVISGEILDVMPLNVALLADSQNAEVISESSKEEASHNVDQREQSNSFANSYDVFYRPPVANSKEEYRALLADLKAGLLEIQKDIDQKLKKKSMEKLSISNDINAKAAPTPLEDDDFSVVTSKKSKRYTQATMIFKRVTKPSLLDKNFHHYSLIVHFFIYCTSIAFHFMGSLFVLINLGK
ncbi:unnamed protein product [Cuscuta europaea]|uniref:Uncharacterized protein n=1 Tax=Cuscuta europaea TaxID=41803 RepID=A0A9P0ZYK0_CUSEU|nr:unnamed protein product [Cuscuta europaea]